MIIIHVIVQNEKDKKIESIEITRDELKQLACNKAEGMRDSKASYSHISAIDETLLK